MSLFFLQIGIVIHNCLSGIFTCVKYNFSYSHRLNKCISRLVKSLSDVSCYWMHWPEGTCFFIFFFFFFFFFFLEKTKRVTTYSSDYATKSINKIQWENERKNEFFPSPRKTISEPPTTTQALLLPLQHIMLCFSVVSDPNSRKLKQINKINKNNRYFHLTFIYTLSIRDLVTFWAILFFSKVQQC